MSRRLVSRRIAPSWTLVLALCLLTAASAAFGQQSQLASRRPRFLLAGWEPGREVDASAAPVLRRRVSLDLTGVTIGEALKEVTRQAALEISYSPRVVPLNRPVSLHAQDIAVAAALTEILLDVAVDVSVTTGGGLALVRRPPTAMSPERLDSGAVAGQVTDSANGSPIVGAMVTIEGAHNSAVTDENGRYRIDGLTLGKHTVRARYIGYRPASVTVTVTVAPEATGDFALARAAQQLEQVVVTGTIVPTEVKALPTPVSVIDESDIRMRSPQTVRELFRQAVPTALSPSFPALPYQTAFSVRGASTLAPGSAQMKVFVDGIEAVSPGVTPVDPSSIERLEVIRGPQAAAIYGSDAIGGVIQIFTKRGDPNLARPQLSAQTAVGLIQTPYAGYDGVLRQNYTASIRGATGEVGYNLGAGYSHTGNYLPNGEQSEQSSPSVYGGTHFARGIVSVDMSGRYYVQNVADVVNPELAQTGFVSFSKPQYAAVQATNQTVGARVSVAPRRWWQHTLMASLDRYTNDYVQSQPRLTTPGDTLLTVANTARLKRSIGYNTSISGSLGARMSGVLTAGFDHYSLPVSRFSTANALNTSGTIQTTGGAFAVTRTVTNNTGYFAQGQLGFHDALFLTVGVRAEHNTNFGDSLRTQLSPRTGLSFVQPVGSATLKVRGSWGRALRAPDPGLKLGSASTSSVILANLALAPERQKGWDAGVDAVLGSRASLSVTYYDQTAENLLQFVQVQSTPILTSQWQNVGRVHNTGVEVEGTLSLGLLQVKGQYGYARARVDALPPNYTGTLRVGDQSLATPKHTAGGSATAVLVLWWHRPVSTDPAGLHHRVPRFRQGERCPAANAHSLRLWIHLGRQPYE
jgi:outer membrane receptor protein involved in Fe transport